MLQPISLHGKCCLAPRTLFNALLKPVPHYGQPQQRATPDDSSNARALLSVLFYDDRYNATRDRPTLAGKNIHLSLMANPSHLEAVTPVVIGKVRAKQH